MGIEVERALPRFTQVGVGALAVGQAPASLVAPALGSCVGVAVYDVVSRRGALAHVMLPSPGDTAVRGGWDSRFASVAVGLMVDRLKRLGVPRRRLVAKIAGGAAMFGGDGLLGTVGERNVAEVKKQLAERRIPIEAEDTGGAHARTVELHLDDGSVVVRSYLFGETRL